jgi:hypothetical protein
LSIDGAGIVSGEGSYVPGEPAAISVQPLTGYRFVQWKVLSGGISLPDAGCSTAIFDMPSKAVEILAVIEKERYTVTIEDDGNGSADGGDYPWGEIVHITAKPEPGYRLANWEPLLGNADLSNTAQPETTFTMPQTLKTIS